MGCYNFKNLNIMSEQEFLIELKEILMLDENPSIESKLEMDSMSTLMLIQLVDEHFNKTITKEDLAKMNFISELVQWCFNE